MRGQQLSVTVSEETKEQLDRFAERHGLHPEVVVEQALLLFIEAYQDLTDEARIPTRLVLEGPTFDRLVDQLERPAEPSKALRALMRGDDD